MAESPFQLDGITLHNADCMDVMRSLPDNHFALAITDPPYFDGPNRSGYYGQGYSSLGVQRAKHYDQIETWDVPGPEFSLKARTTCCKSQAPADRMLSPRP